MKQDIKHNTAIIIACGALMVFISMGTRQSFGLFFLFIYFAIVVKIMIHPI